MNPEAPIAHRPEWVAERQLGDRGGRDRWEDYFCTGRQILGGARLRIGEMGFFGGFTQPLILDMWDHRWYKGQAASHSRSEWQQRSVGWLHRRGGPLVSVTKEGKVTWLILPVVICLSQRLSHACVSINSFVL